jgi:hypothetical protein
MTSNPAITLLLPLGKRRMNQLIIEAERIGLLPEDYAKQPAWQAPGSGE